MKKRLNSKWISHKMTNLYCIDFSGHGSDRASVWMEMEAAEAVLCQQSAHSLLASLDLSLTDFSDEIAGFINRYGSGEKSPFRKLAILGVSHSRRIWYQMTRRVIWPKNARFFNQYEKAKDWLISEGYE